MTHLTGDDVAAMTLANNVKHATKLIDAAEHDLGPLSDGECRDLLMDNTHWDSGMVRRVVASIRTETFGL